MKRFASPYLLPVLAVVLALVVFAWQSMSGTPIQSNQRLIQVGLYENAPKIYTGERGRPAGLFVDILNEIAQREGWKLKYVPCAWADCLQKLEQGEIDLMPDVAFSTERAQRYAFHTVSVASSWSQVYSNPDLKVMSLGDLAGKRVAILEGGIQQSFLRQLMASGKYGYQEVPVSS
ncbi:MAG TPA: transporter substrate-binding domain-containing protein, partial [Rhodocyclaceae bacterium]|nr:transporter substrate-binding domain-containing protein [Rhodocyclaceae bacterium]